MTAYYNENAEFPATWLQQLITGRQIIEGRVDVRSIRDVLAADVIGVQAHFFAGIGGWPYALRLAGWPDELPVWTGSCPCQPFSTAGKKGGFDDERHLWPEWFRLIRECRPPIIFGEQVASPAGRAWLDLVSTDLEGAGYAVGAANLCAAGIGAPHIRQRLFWVAVACEQRREEFRLQLQPGQSRQAGAEVRRSGEAGRLGHTASARRDEPEVGSPTRSDAKACTETREWRTAWDQQPKRASAVSRLGNTSGTRSARDIGAIPGAEAQSPPARFGARRLVDESIPAGATSGFWGDAEWWLCRDGRARAAQPGTFPLVDGSPGRVGRLRAYGNSIVPHVAAIFIRAVQESLCA